MSEEELIRMVQQIRVSSGCMMDLDGLLGKFEANVKNPAASQLIFESPTGRMMTPEEVVEKAGVKRKS